MDWDVIIVGSGIGGAAAAFFLTQQGCRVAVFEKESLPRYKACAGGVTPGAQALLPFSLEPVTETVVTEVIYNLRQQEHFRQPLNSYALLMVKRANFDHYVLRQSKAEIIETTPVEWVEEHENKVRIRTKDGKQYEAHYVIGADGANSVVARSLGLRHHKTLGAAVEVEVPASPELLDRYRRVAWFEFGALENGYLWIFPKSDLLSVGIGAFGRTSVDLRNVLRREMLRLGISIDGLQWHGHPLPIHLWAERVGTTRCMLVGDAAGLVDAFLGEGIRYAIMSAKIAAEAVLQDSVPSYSKQVKVKISDGLRRARYAAQIFYRFPDLSYRCITRNPAFTRAFMKMLAGEVTYRELSHQLPLYFAQSLLR